MLTAPGRSPITPALLLLLPTPLPSALLALPNKPYAPYPLALPMLLSCDAVVPPSGGSMPTPAVGKKSLLLVARW